MPPAQPDFSAAFASLAQQLACPACHGTLRLQQDELVCNLCEMRYPIVDGIPVLVPAAPSRS